MIVVAIVGTLSAVALPQYRRAVAVAEASSSILEAVAFAEQCAVAHKSGHHDILHAFFFKHADPFAELSNKGPM
jgi:Tfp pilus assembly protein PilE